MGDDDKTPRLTRPRRKTPNAELPTVTCPHCRKTVLVMPSGLLELHPVRGRWAKSMCRGSGQPSSLSR